MSYLFDYRRLAPETIGSMKKVTGVVFIFHPSFTYVGSGMKNVRIWNKEMFGSGSEIRDKTSRIRNTGRAWMMHVISPQSLVKIQDQSVSSLSINTSRIAI
jgi:hypothetical protein